MTFDSNDVMLLRNAQEAELVFDLERDVDIVCDQLRAKMCLSPGSCSHQLDSDVTVEGDFLMVDVTQQLKQLQTWFNDSLEQPVITVALYDFQYRSATKNGTVVLVLHAVPKDELADGIDISELQHDHDSERQRRSLPEQSPQDDVCNVYSWQVNFADIGWNFVVAPKSFVPNFCAGTCELTDDPQGYYIANHALVKFHFARIEGNDDLPLSANRGCCVPRRMDPLSVVYSYGNGTVVNRLLSEMTVRDCACY